MSAAGDGRRIVISGCSGGGKSTLLAELARRGFATVAEPGRRVIAATQAAGGRALPWIDMPACARALVAMARRDLAAAAGQAGPVFFDRGLVDAAAALAHATGQAIDDILADTPRFDARVFMVPPWPAIYVQDAGRRHDLAAAIAEHDRLAALYPALGYTVASVPRLPVAARADWLLATLDRG